MAKHKRSRKTERALATAETAVAARHEFGAGILGHDLTASWLVNVSETTALGLDVVADCVQVICDAVAGSEVGQWNGNIRIDPPSSFTLRPDPDMDRYDFLWLFAANLALYRAVYLEEAEFDGAVIAVRLHCIATVSRIAGEYYIAGQRVKNRMRLIRRSVWPTLDIDTGSTINLAREVFAGAMSANAYQSDFWQQGGAPVMYIKTEQPITGTQAEDISDRYIERRTTSPGKPPVMGFGADIKPLSTDIASAGANTSADKIRASLARYFGMPPGMVNVASEAGPLTYTTEEQEGIKLVKYTFTPYCNVIGNALSRYLPGDYLIGDRIVVDPSKFTRAGQLARFQAWESATRARWLDPDEIRAAEGYAPMSDEQRERFVTAPVDGGGVANVGA